uniref:Uncharacterized protein n=1 Tax=Tetradesmus obliquus TaxID=3088 RepID=A0A383VYS1_TETOB
MGAEQQRGGCATTVWQHSHRHVAVGGATGAVSATAAAEALCGLAAATAAAAAAEGRPYHCRHDNTATGNLAVAGAPPGL